MPGLPTKRMCRQGRSGKRPAFGQLLLGLHLGHHFENAIPDMLHAHHFVELGDTRFRGRLPGEAVVIGGSDAGIVRLGGGVARSLR